MEVGKISSFCPCLTDFSLTEQLGRHKSKGRRQWGLGVARKMGWGEGGYTVVLAKTVCSEQFQELTREKTCKESPVVT